MIRALLISLVLSAPTAAAVFGDKIPPEPAYYSVLCLPPNYSNNTKCRELIAATATQPELVTLRRETAFHVYSSADPDFQHRFSPRERLPELWTRAVPALLVVDRGGGLVWGSYGFDPTQLASQIRNRGVLQEIRGELSHGIFRRPRRPKVCIDCEPTTTPGQPNQPVDDGTEPLRPILPPIGDTPQEPGTEPTPTDPPGPAPTDPLVAEQAKQIQQLQAAIAELKQQININVPQQPAISETELKFIRDGVTQILAQINLAKNAADEAKAQAEKPFFIRVVDPRGIYTTDYKQVKLGQQIDLILEPLNKGFAGQ